MISADNALNTLVNRTNNPITVPASGSVYSYEKWLKLKIDGVPANSVSNFKAWSAQGGAGGVATGVTLNGEGGVTSYTTPVNTQRGTASALPTTQGSALQWDSASYSALNAVTKYLVLQLKVDSTAAPGNIPQVTVNYSYDEL